MYKLRDMSNLAKLVTRNLKKKFRPDLVSIRYFPLVTRTLDDFHPILRQLALEECATNPCSMEACLVVMALKL
jgi:hypothetical protein